MDINPEFNIINVVDDCQDEEDEQDILRRQEELKAHVADNLTDYVDSQECTDDDDDGSNFSESSLGQERLKLMYEVQSQELNEIRRHYNTCCEQKAKDEEAMKVQLALLKSELEQVQISLKQSQELVVNRTGDLLKEKEVTRMLGEKVKGLEEALKRAVEENVNLKESNENLSQQLLSMQTSVIRAGKLEEQEMNQQTQLELENNKLKLETAEKTISKLENLKNKLENDLQQIKQEKDDLLFESNKTINYLKDTINAIQMEGSDLSDAVQKLTVENEGYKGKLRKLEEVLNNLMKSHPIKCIEEIDVYISGLKHEILELQSKIKQMAENKLSDQPISTNDGNLAKRNLKDDENLTDTQKTCNCNRESLTKQYVVAMNETAEEMKALKLEIDRLNRDNIKHLRKIEELLHEKNTIGEKLSVEQEENKHLKDQINIAREKSIEKVNMPETITTDSILRELEIREELKRDFEDRLNRLKTQYKETRKSDSQRHMEKIHRYKTKIHNLEKCVLQEIKGLKMHLVSARRERQRLEATIQQKDDMIVKLANVAKQLRSVNEQMKNSIFVSFSAITNFLYRRKLEEKELFEKLE